MPKLSTKGTVVHYRIFLSFFFTTFRIPRRTQRIKWTQQACIVCLKTDIFRFGCFSFRICLTPSLFSVLHSQNQFIYHKLSNLIFPNFKQRNWKKFANISQKYPIWNTQSIRWIRIKIIIFKQRINENIYNIKDIQKP